MLKSFKYRIYPNKNQKITFLKTFGCVRKVYNELVAWNIIEYNRWKENGKKKGDFAKTPLVTSIKNDFSFLNEVDSLALANAKINFETAKNNFINSVIGKRKGRKVKPPKFKKKGVCKYSYTTNNQGGTVKLTSNHYLKLPKIKQPIKLLYHRELIGKIKSCTISMEKDGTFYASILCECEQQAVHKREAKKVIGLDMSLTHFYVSSDKEENNNLHYIKRYRKNEKKLKRMGRCFSRRKTIEAEEVYFNHKWNKEVHKRINSKNKEKARLLLAKLYRKIANQRLDFVCQTANRLTKQYDVIVIEDIDMQSMSRVLKLGKSVSDMGWGMFVKWLEWDSDKNGSTLIKAERKYASSKLCHECGYKYSELTLSDREWICPKCGKRHDRDYNAALNLREYYYKNICTAGTAETNACGELSSTVDNNLPQLGSLKQEAPQSLAEG